MCVCVCVCAQNTHKCASDSATQPFDRVFGASATQPTTVLLVVGASHARKHSDLGPFGHGPHNTYICIYIYIYTYECTLTVVCGFPEVDLTSIGA